MRRRFTGTGRLAAAILIALVALVIGVWLGGHPGWLPSGLRNAFVDNSDGRLVHDALNILARDYYRPINRTSLVNKGLAAAVASLDDPYSHYLDPSDYREFENQSNPHVSGVGIDVLSSPRGLRVIDVFPGTPAARAGIRAGDLIVAVGNTSLAGRSAEAATGLITGQQGTAVLLTVVSGHRRRVMS
jgi:carboxyl-terminal processing protease